MFYILLLVVVGIGKWLLYRVQRATRRDDIMFLAKQYGYRFHDSLTLADFAECTSPPWDTFNSWSDDTSVDEVLQLSKPNGRVFSFNMYANLLTDDDDAHDFLISVVGMRVDDVQLRARIEALITTLKFKNGICLAMRGAFVYAMVYPTMRRSYLMTYRERIACMRALTRMLAGELEQGQALLEKINGDGVVRMLIWLPIVYCGVYYSVKSAVYDPDTRMAIGIGWAVVLLFCRYVSWSTNRAMALRDYFWPPYR